MIHTLNTKFDPSNNNFDLIRLGAALIVVLSHSYSLVGAPWEPISRLFNYGYGGTLAVAVFFVISGFLIARSVQLQELSIYIRSRLLRIIPALILVTLIEAFVIAPLFYEGESLRYYFQVDAPRHLLNIFVFGEDPWMANVFSKLPWPYVNGSLWSLPVESLFYILLPFLMLVAAGGRRWVLLAIFVASLFAEPIARHYGLNESQRGVFLFKTVSLFQTTQFFSYFMAGVVAWSYRDRITWNKGYFLLCTLILFAAQNSLTAPLALKLCLPYIVLFVGLYNGVGTKLKRKIGDLSYGVYLIGYPVINSVISLGAMKLSPEIVFGIAASVSLIFAWFSWHLVERPALKLKSKLAPKPPLSEPLRNKASAEIA